MWLAGIFTFIGLVLVAVFAAAFHFSRGKLAIAILAPAAVMAAFGAFAGSTAAALASVSWSGALWRGSLIGFAQGLVVGAVLAGGVWIFRRLRGPSGPSSRRER